MPKFRVRFVAALAVMAMVAAACGDEPTSDTSQPEEQDLLERVEDRGVLEIATDSKYKPQSWFVYATGEWKGFDVDVAQRGQARLSEQLGVEIQPRSSTTTGPPT